PQYWQCAMTIQIHLIESHRHLRGRHTLQMKKGSDGASLRCAGLKDPLQFEVALPKAAGAGQLHPNWSTNDISVAHARRLTEGFVCRHQELRNNSHQLARGREVAQIVQRPPGTPGGDLNFALPDSRVLE